MSLDLAALKIFVKVAQLGSFTRAGDHLGMSKARISMKVKALEAQLGTRLLQRTTRAVQPTDDGVQLLSRAPQLLQQADEVAAMFQSARALRGRVKVDLPVNIARDLIIPKLPELLLRHPALELTFSTTDRRVDAVREGFDVVLRAGAVGDDGLVGRKLGALRMINCASPAYLQRQGTPLRLEDLDAHLVVHYSSTVGPQAPSFEYPFEGGWKEWPMRSLLTVNSVDAYLAAGAAGLGILQLPFAGMRQRLTAGTMVEVLPAFPCAPLPLFLLHTHGRNVPKRVRAVIAWLLELVTAEGETLGH